MPLSLFRVDRIAEVPTANGATLFLVRGETVEDTPQLMTFKTVKPFQAALCERAKATNQYVSVGWRQSRNYLEGDIVTCDLDTSKFVHEANQ